MDGDWVNEYDIEKAFSCLLKLMSDFIRYLSENYYITQKIQIQYYSFEKMTYFIK